MMLPGILVFDLAPARLPDSIPADAPRNPAILHSNWPVLESYDHQELQ